MNGHGIGWLPRYVSKLFPGRIVRNIYIIIIIIIRWMLLYTMIICIRIRYMSIAALLVDIYNIIILVLIGRCIRHIPCCCGGSSIGWME